MIERFEACRTCLVVRDASSSIRSLVDQEHRHVSFWYMENFLRTRWRMTRGKSYVCLHLRRFSYLPFFFLFFFFYYWMPPPCRFRCTCCTSRRSAASDSIIGANESLIDDISRHREICAKPYRAFRIYDRLDRNRVYTIGAINYYEYT